MATHPNAKIRFHASDMTLHIDTDAAYLIAPGAKSQVAGYYHLSTTHSGPNKPTHIPLNGAIHVECSLLKHVTTSSA